MAVDENAVLGEGITPGRWCTEVACAWWLRSVRTEVSWYRGRRMDAAELRRGRRLFHAHTATGLIGFLGWLAVVGFSRALVAAVVPWLLIGLSLVMCASGVLAIRIKRTFITGPAEPGDGPHGDVGDAMSAPGIHTFDFLPAYTRAVAPYGLFGVGLVFLAVSIFGMVVGLR